MAKSLEQVIKKANSLADIISKRVAANAPRKAGAKGGNLRKALLKANNLETMLNLKKETTKGVSVKSLEFTIDYAPEGAEYGKYWNDPDISWQVKNRKTKNNPNSENFAEKALAEPKVIKALDDLYDLIANSFLEALDNTLNEMESEY